MARLRVAAIALAVAALVLLASPASAAGGAAKKKGGKKSNASSGKKVVKRATRAALVQGDATWYTGIEAGFCQFFGNLPADRFIVAVPAATSAGPPQGAACGSCLAVFCRAGFVSDAFGSFNLDRTDACASASQGIVARVTDICPCQGNEAWCCSGGADGGRKPHLDLSQEAFRALIKGGDVGLGLMSIEWAPVSCDLLGQRPTREAVLGSGGGGVAVATPTAQTPPPVTTAEVRPPNPVVVIKPVTKPVVVVKPVTKPVVVVKPVKKPLVVVVRPPTKPGQAKPPLAVAAARPRPITPAVVDVAPPACAADGSCPADLVVPDPVQFAAAAARLCPTVELWSQASSVPLAVRRRALAPLEQCGGSGAFCCAFARSTANGAKAAGSCRDAPFAGRTCPKDTKCVRVDAYYWQCK